MGDKAKVCKFNVDQSPKIAQRFGVMSIPTALIFKGGKVVDKFVGVMPKQTIVDKLNAVILAKTGPANCGLGGLLYTSTGIVIWMIGLGRSAHVYKSYLDMIKCLRNHPTQHNLIQT